MSAPEAGALERLARTWATPKGWLGALGSVDHKIIGIRYIVTAFFFLLVGGAEALLIRIQLAHSNAGVLPPELYDQLFTMHGVTMLFLFALPMLSGFSNYLWPLMIGARDMAFPRVNAMGYWLFLGAGIFLYTSLPLGVMPDAGWFNYVPLSSAAFTPGLNIDFFALGLLFLGISTTAGAINFIVTFFKMRAPGMALDRVPILLWGTLTASFSVIFALPALSVACLFLYLDRHFGMHFFDTIGGGQPLMWQHLFWIFGHPWVYIIVLPAMSMMSDLIPTFSRRPLVAYPYVALSTVAVGIIGFGVWAHHMFATGLSTIALSFFSGASLLIAVPSAVSVFAWVSTVWLGRPVFTTAFLFALGFIVIFVIGGVSGVMTGSSPLDWQLTDSYFVVAHLHYVLIGINLFPVVGAMYYWFPKMTGRRMSERLGKWNFWLMFVAFNVGFFPMHLLGLLGMPRRVYTYASGLGWDGLNELVTLGAFGFAAGFLLLLVNAWWSLRHGEPAGDNPWGGGTLEWSVSSPPPPYNFATLPRVGSRHPLWEGRFEPAGGTVLDQGPLLEDGPLAVSTRPLDAEPTAILPMPEESLWPFYLSVATLALFYALLWDLWIVAAMAAIGIAISVIGWLWPAGRAGSAPLSEAEPGGVQ